MLSISMYLYHASCVLSTLSMIGVPGHPIHGLLWISPLQYSYFRILAFRDDLSRILSMIIFIAHAVWRYSFTNLSILNIISISTLFVPYYLLCMDFKILHYVDAYFFGFLSIWGCLLATPVLLWIRSVLIAIVNYFIWAYCSNASFILY